MFHFIFRLLLGLVILSCLILAGLRFAAWLREASSVADLAPKNALYIETQNGTFFALANGPENGPPILLAHGTAAWSGFWSDEVEYLGSNGFRAIAFDMPPFGFSERPADGDYSRTRQADRILALAATFETPPILVAHSFGAAAATEAVLRSPETFTGFVIVDGAIGMSEAPQDIPFPAILQPKILRETAVAASVSNPLATKPLLRSLLYNKDAASDDLVETLQLPFAVPGSTRAYADWLPSLLAPSAESKSRHAENYASLPIPVRLIWGAEDTVNPPKQAEALAAALDQGPVTYLSEVGHIPHIEAPEKFRAALMVALDQILTIDR